MESYNSVSQAEKRQAAAAKRTLVIVALSLMAIAVAGLMVREMRIEAQAKETAALQTVASRPLHFERWDNPAELDAEQPRISGRP